MNNILLEGISNSTQKELKDYLGLSWGRWKITPWDTVISQLKEKLKGEEYIPYKDSSYAKKLIEHVNDDEVKEDEARYLLDLIKMKRNGIPLTSPLPAAKGDMNPQDIESLKKFGLNPDGTKIKKEAKSKSPKDPHEKTRIRLNNEKGYNPKNFIPNTPPDPETDGLPPVGQTVKQEGSTQSKGTKYWSSGSAYNRNKREPISSPSPQPKTPSGEDGGPGPTPKPKPYFTFGNDDENKWNPMNWGHGTQALGAILLAAGAYALYKKYKKGKEKGQSDQEFLQKNPQAQRYVENNKQ